MTPQGPPLTPRAWAVLRQMAAADAAKDYDEAEIVCEGGQCWLGCDQLSTRTVQQLLLAVLLSADGFGSKVERYTLNESGRRLVAGQPPYCDRNGKYHWLFTDL